MTECVDWANPSIWRVRDTLDVVPVLQEIIDKVDGS